MITFKYKVNNDYERMLERFQASYDAEESFIDLEKVTIKTLPKSGEPLRWWEMSAYEEPVTRLNHGISREVQKLDVFQAFQYAKAVKGTLTIRKLKRYSEVTLTFTW